MQGNKTYHNDYHPRLYSHSKTGFNIGINKVSKSGKSEHGLFFRNFNCNVIFSFCYISTCKCCWVNVLRHNELGFLLFVLYTES